MLDSTFERKMKMISSSENLFIKPISSSDYIGDKCDLISREMADIIYYTYTLIVNVQCTFFTYKWIYFYCIYIAFILISYLDFAWMSRRSVFFRLNSFDGAPTSNKIHGNSTSLL